MTNDKKELTETAKAEKTVKETNETSAVSYIKNITTEIFAVLFWLYLTIKLLIIDIDVILIFKFFPQFTWVLDLKFFFILGILALSLIIFKTKDLLLFGAYVLFYPVILLLWKLPYFVFKQKSWLLLFALLNFCISLFFNAKRNVIIYSIFLISVACIFNASNHVIVWLSVFATLAFLTVIYLNRCYSIFKASSVFQASRRLFQTISKNSFSSLSIFSVNDEIKDLPVDTMNDKQLSEWGQGLQMSVLYNRICLFSSKKLRDYQKSDLNTVVSVMNIVLLVALTTFCFAVMNYGLFKIDPANFQSLSSTPSFFLFFYYSFNAFLFNSTDGLQAVSMPSQLLFMIECFFSLFLMAIFVSLLITVKQKRHEDELNEIIEEFERNGNDMESFIRSEYKIENIQEAIQELEKVKSDLIKIIYKISENIP